MDIYFDEIISYWIVGGVLLFGVLLNFVRQLAYSTFVRESYKGKQSKNKYIMNILYSYRKKMENASDKEKIINNYVDKCMYSLRFCGLKLYTWDKLCNLNLVSLIAVCSLLCVLAGYAGMTQRMIMVMVLAGLLAVSVLIMLNIWTYSAAKSNIIYFNIFDFLSGSEEAVKKLRAKISVENADTHKNNNTCEESTKEDSNKQNNYEENSVSQLKQVTEAKTSENEKQIKNNSNNNDSESINGISVSEKSEVIRKALTDAIYEAALEKMAVSYTQQTANKAVEASDNKVINILKNKEKKEDDKGNDGYLENGDSQTNNKLIEAIIRDILQ